MVAFVKAARYQPVSVRPAPVLTLPYRSQWDSDASDRASTCGQTCVAMLAEWRGIRVAINDLPYQSTVTGLTTARDLVANLQFAGLRGRVVCLPPGQTPPLPAICLVWYGGFDRRSVQDTHFTGWHWLVLLAAAPTHVVTHDPDFWGTRRRDGAFKQYQLDEWQRAFIPPAHSSSTTSVIVTTEG